jgi:hypothetical protein
MAFTDFSDLFASINESAINNVVRDLQRQRPSLFNYGTSTFIQHPEFFCQRIRADKDVFLFNNPLATQEDLISIPGYSGPFGLEWCLQLSELSIDFHPSNVHSLPSELNPPLAAQHFSLKAKLCIGLGCPEAKLLDKIAPTEKPYFPVVDTGGDIKQPNRPEHTAGKPEDKPTNKPPDRPLPFEKPICFCLDLFAVFHLALQGTPNDPILALKLDNLEIVDIKPDGLENSAECFMKTMLLLGLLPKIRLALRALVFRIADVITITPAPVSANIPFNPAVEQDQLKIFVNLIV